MAKDTCTSISGVQRVLKMIPVSRLQRLPEAVSFGEFKGNTGGERFQCIVTDPLNRRVLDILPTRTVETIQHYLLSFPNRDEVKYVVMDMNRGFRDVAKAFFPNAKIIILNLLEFEPCRKMLVNWRPYILNAFGIHLSNGFTEGCNNAIKTLKRVAFGFRSFDSFRARILLAVKTYPNI